MNKKTLRIAGWALGLSMAVAGIGLAVNASVKAPVETMASTEQSITINASSMGISSWGSGYQSGLLRSATISGIDIHGHYLMKNNKGTPTNAAAATYIQVQKSNANIYNADGSPLGLRIKSITVNQSAAAPWSLYAGTSELFSDTETGTGKTPSTGDLLVSPSTATSMTWNSTPQADKNDLSDNDYTYFCLVLGGTNTYVSSIVVTYDVPTKVSGVALDQTALTIKSDDTSTPKTITATINSAADNKYLTVTHKSGDSLVTIGGLTDGKIQANGSGIATFTVTGKGLTSGTEVITVAATDGSGKSADLTITAANALASAVNLDVTSFTGYRGQTVTLTASVANFVPAKYVWTNGNTSSAKIGDSSASSVEIVSSETSNSVTITLLGDSAASFNIGVTAYDGEDNPVEEVGACTITVVASTHSLAVSPSGAQSVQLGKTISLTPTITNTGAYSTSTVSVSKNNANVSLSSSSVSSGSAVTITGEALGSSTVTFSTADSDSVSVVVTVVPPEKNQSLWKI